MQEHIGPERASSEVFLGRCLVDGDEARKSGAYQRRHKALGISFSIEALAVAMLVVVPLMTSIAQPRYIGKEIVPFVFGRSYVHAAAQRPTTTKHHTSSFGDPRVVFATDNPPRRPSQGAEESNDISNSEPDLIVGQASPFEMLIPGGRITGPVTPPPGETKKPEEKHPLKISEPVLQAQLITRIEPRYPPLAQQTRQEGTVLLHAIISRDGRIVSLEVVSGSPLFIQAALDAVRQWRYRPTILDGDPVDVDTSITVKFRLSR